MLSSLLRGKSIRLSSSLSAASIQVELTSRPSPKPKLSSDLMFGAECVDHMLLVDWTKSEGWGVPQIKPMQPIMMDPSASVLHYGTTCFEGIKAFYSQTGGFVLFRPEMYLKRMNESAVSIGLPNFDVQQMLKCLVEFVRVEKDWVPTEKGYSLYIRTTLIGSHVQLGIVHPEFAKLFSVASPVGSYFNKDAIKVLCDENIAKSWPGGVGNRNLGGNLGPMSSRFEETKKKGYDEMLWVTENMAVTELTLMNLFVLWRTPQGNIELATPFADSTILHGVMRDSVINTCKEWNEVSVSEKKFTILELVEALNGGRVIEMFGASTACGMRPISNLYFRGVDHQIPKGELCSKINGHLNSIQYGEIDHPWAYKFN